MGRKAKDGGFNRPFADLQARVPLPKPVAPVSKLAPKAAPAPAPRTPQTDEEMFLEAVGGVAPIPKAKRVSAPAAEPRPARKSDDAEVLAQLADLCEGAGTFDIADSDEYIEGLGDGVDRRLLQRLRAGEFAVQGHVDLHGMTREEARGEVARFLTGSRRDGKRCVLIVHGRGQHSKDQIPVLKQAVRSWLERGSLARSVLAFATARPHDGGAGAVYVLLRK